MKQLIVKCLERLKSSFLLGQILVWGIFWNSVGVHNQCIVPHCSFGSEFYRGMLFGDSHEESQKDCWKPTTLSKCFLKDMTYEK